MPATGVCGRGHRRWKDPIPEGAPSPLFRLRPGDHCARPPCPSNLCVPRVYTRLSSLRWHGRTAALSRNQGTLTGLQVRAQLARSVAGPSVAVPSEHSTSAASTPPAGVSSSTAGSASTHGAATTGSNGTGLGTGEGAAGAAADDASSGGGTAGTAPTELGDNDASVTWPGRASCNRGTS
jgi:hypothetical protein